DRQRSPGPGGTPGVYRPLHRIHGPDRTSPPGQRSPTVRLRARSRIRGGDVADGTHEQADATELLRRGTEELDSPASQTGAGHGDAATVDSEWSVRDLVNHLVYEDLWAPPLLAGSTIAEIGDQFEGDVLGDDPQQAWATASGQTAAAIG